MMIGYWDGSTNDGVTQTIPPEDLNGILREYLPVLAEPPYSTTGSLFSAVSNLNPLLPTTDANSAIGNDHFYLNAGNTACAAFPEFSRVGVPQPRRRLSEKEQARRKVRRKMARESRRRNR
jgi:hypothetical protein